ncbi:hypothetical protein [Ralstonia pseudosolanacearum]|uniref:hypothetical protein n=1 Tax=Ralstonia pseudosolanacearum TaxID=1310165 RepID=UPI0012FDBFB7|nr:hypothetical protein [Ralstonia pseudosolanacearum]UYR03799.1 hypothetical protein NQS37_22375 [Ralstonia pseudosolanacearum]UYR14602.1 hypothetical protein NQS35_18450 [Ralstonia pseudosolanacearum]
MFPAKIENLRRNPVCLQRYRHVVARKRQHGLTTTLIYATTPFGFDGDALAWAIRSAEMPPNNEINSAALNMFDLNTGISPELNGTSI